MPDNKEEKPMSKRIRTHVRGNMVGYLALFVALSGSAYAAGGITGAGVAENSVAEKAASERPKKRVKARCPKRLTVLRGHLCAGSDGGIRTWDQAMNYCVNLGLELPTLTQARAMAKKRNVPGVPAGGPFWTNDAWEEGDESWSYVAFEDGGWSPASPGAGATTVCTRAPSYR
jgi:hypothetical protein